jgi:hypothetical protein
MTICRLYEHIRNHVVVGIIIFTVKILTSAREEAWSEALTSCSRNRQNQFTVGDARLNDSVRRIKRSICSTCRIMFAQNSLRTELHQARYIRQRRSSPFQFIFKTPKNASFQSASRSISLCFHQFSKMLVFDHFPLFGFIINFYPTN